MAYKKCPQNHSCGVRSLQCSECGYIFKSAAKGKKLKSSAARPVKSRKLPKLKLSNPSKTPLIKRSKYEGEEIKDWRELVKGDKIKVSEGPYWTVRNPYNGVIEKIIPMGENGIYTVSDTNDQGIFATNIKKSGMVFISMLKGLSFDPKYKKIPHKILRLIPFSSKDR